MYELIQVSESAYYIASPANIGVVKVSPDHVVVIDSGSDKDAGKKIKRILEANSWTLDAVYNTHFHADHVGGNRYLQQNTGCRIYCPEIEAEFVRHPFLEPSFLFGGMPPKELRHKFLMVKESKAEDLKPEDLPENMEMFSLPGHSFNMTGYRTDDGVFYIADCLASKETLDKYQVSFMVDPEAYIETLKHITDIQADLYIPCHAEPCTRDELKELAEINIEKVYEVAEKLILIAETPKTFDEILKEVFEVYNLEMTFEQNALLGSAIRSYLSWLEGQEKVRPVIEGNFVKWVKV